LRQRLICRAWSHSSQSCLHLDDGQRHVNLTALSWELFEPGNRKLTSARAAKPRILFIKGGVTFGAHYCRSTGMRVTDSGELLRLLHDQRVRSAAGRSSVL